MARRNAGFHTRNRVGAAAGQADCLVMLLNGAAVGLENAAGDGINISSTGAQPIRASRAYEADSSRRNVFPYERDWRRRENNRGRPSCVNLVRPARGDLRHQIW